MKVGWVGTFDPTFSRNRSLLRWLEEAGVEVEVTRFELWGTDRVNLAQRCPIRLLSGILRYPLLAIHLFLKKKPDVYLVSHPGWFDMPFVAVVARLRRVPLVFDAFISLYDTVVEDRRLYHKDSIVGRLTRAVDVLSLRLADQVVADTEPHLDYFRQTAGRTSDWGAILPVGADDRTFTTYKGPVDDRLVVFYGTLVPLQGIETILRAADILADSGIRTVIIGDGQESHKIEAALASGAGQYLEWRPPVSLEALPAMIAPAAICLGIFGSSDKANRVVPHKVFESLAMRKPVVTRDSAAIRSLFVAGEIRTVDPEDPRALAAAVRNLIADPVRRNELAEAGNSAYLQRLHGSILSRQLHQILQQSADFHGVPHSD